MTYSQLTNSALLVGMLGASSLAVAQQAPHTITTAVPILTLSPDARSAALGEAGVASSPDANAAYFNAGKLGFAPNRFSISPSYSPWLNSATNKGGLWYLSGYGRLGQRSTLGASVMYFSLGYTGAIPVRGNESAYSVSYGHTFGEHFGVGASVRYIRSTLSTYFLGAGGAAADAAAMDVGVYYTKDIPAGADAYTLALGASIANIGNKISYSNPSQADFLPTNLKIGTALTRTFGPSHKLTLVVDANKLLVPSPYYEEGTDTTPAALAARAARTKEENDKRHAKGTIAGAFSSFSDAPGGFREELREIRLSTGLEYAYQNTVFARAGYFYESPVKGDRNYLSFGVGGRYRALGLDGAYLVPNSRNNPLAQTVRVSLHVSLSKRDVASST
ncbi:type IX secretion system outer membrane channel protein PorV [Hymenobacter sp. YC55]|uniref:type IX secretion system outer membrane channel protein PorV n=1 Tax=Hymenobacter sp. YC55 TaxID=3034019 RepID=UPI0023F958BD|nr:type IX secretion system outer membrane channel protein PorV [Hymenobacter sp. YC55]MDF7811708.1 type IX secretion system outer membrane channel protein PorV [Hymenobacter sp. YC55]